MTARIQEEFARAIQENVFPGAAVLVASHGEIVYRNFFGVTEQTLFDIASLTKVVATTTLTLLAKKEALLNLDQHLLDLFPDIEEDKHKISLRHLLKHTSGLPAWRPYFQDLEREQPALLGKREGRNFYFQQISHEPLELPIGYQRLYSDLGFILLGILLENVCKKSLDQLFAEWVTAPLELRNTFFRPNDQVGKPESGNLRDSSCFAITENSIWRKKLLQGEVHDDNAYALGGVAGHAGLFSSVDDLHRFLNEMTYVYHGRSTWLPQETLLEFVGPKVRFKLGWDTPAPTDSQAGRYFDKNSVGHLGFTGCSFWVNLDDEFHIILLTNRIHPSAANDQIKIWRPKIHDLLYEEFLKP